MSVEDPRAYPQRPIIGVGAVVIRAQRVLLVRRGRAPNLGEWAVPGGRLELGETLQQAAEREVHEETGVRIKAGATIHAFDIIEHDAQAQVRFHYVVVDLEAKFVSGEIQARSDALEVAWVSPAQLDQLKVNATTRDLLRRVGFTA